MAAANLAAGVDGTRPARALSPMPGNVPPGFAPGVLPLTRPAEPVLWDALPFTRIRVEHMRPGIDGTAVAALPGRRADHLCLSALAYDSVARPSSGRFWPPSLPPARLCC
ncbi:MAG: hypothetical protein R2851_16480 [Caldilineaceae bacterium]